jgi:hypothetical protein
MMDSRSQACRFVERITRPSVVTDQRPSSTMIFATLSASAPIVFDGFAPIASGTIAPSAT